MRLTINALNIMDYGQYFCVAKNELNTTMATFEIISEFWLIKRSHFNGVSVTILFVLTICFLIEKNPALETPIVRNELVIFGKKPPESSCPPQVCADCPDSR